MSNTYFDYELFNLTPLIVTIDIKLCARIECGVKQLMSLVTSSGELVLYYMFGGMKPLAKRLSWFDDSKKTIQDLCFDPTATWLLVLTLDSSLYIIPALKILDPEQKIDCKWSVNDLTYFPRTQRFPEATPGVVIWWQTLECNQNAIIGYDSGELCFVSLTDGQVIGNTAINAPVTTLNICQDNSLDAVTLLITSESKQQWRLLLEQRSISYIWSPEIKFESTSIESKMSRFKQMSSSIKQKLSDMNRKEPVRKLSNTEIIQEIVPEKLINLGETFLRPQYAKNRHLFSGYFTPTSLLTIHGVEINGMPLYVHKLHGNCRDILMTDRFFFTVDEDYNRLSVISSQLSEARLDGDSEFNPEALLASFRLPNKNEIILSLYKLSDITSTRGSSELESSSRSDSLFRLPKTVQDLQVRNPKVDTCILVTNLGVYKIVLKCSVIEVFMHFVCVENNIEKAEKLAIIFGLNFQMLLEKAGDLLLANDRFVDAIGLYKLSRCRLLKSVLKFAVAGNATELLRYIQTCLAAPNIDISLPTKIHLSNLAVMSYTEKHLRTIKKSTNLQQFIEFLSRNDYFDQVLAVNILCQTSLWSLMTILVRKRGLSFDVLETICKLIKDSPSPPTERDFFICLSEPIHSQFLITNASLAKVFLNFVMAKVDDFDQVLLERFLELLDPTGALIRPVVAKLFEKVKNEDIEFQEVIHEEQVSIFGDLLQTFIALLLRKIQVTGPCFDDELMHISNWNLKNQLIESHEFLQPRSRILSAGYGHCALIRNNSVWTWGITAGGCLGLGPLMTKYHLPEKILLFQRLGTEILSVDCGRTHTLVLTNFGVYTFGSNTYGQLGVPDIVQSPYPVLIQSLSHERIVDISAGQYHSLALTSTGKVYSWGWGVHGQLGHGDVEDVYIPKIIALPRIVQIAAGHAHSLVLDVDGIVYGFGSNSFGQLGVKGDSKKFNTPQEIIIPEKVISISTKYFQSFGITSSGLLYTWGASPQVLRLAAQVQKKNRLNNRTLAAVVTHIQNDVDEGSQGDPKVSGSVEKHCDEEKTKEDNLEASNDLETQPHLQPKLVNLANVDGVIKDVFGGCHHSALMTTDGTFYTWGKNLDGQLGTGSRKDVLIPTFVKYSPFLNQDDENIQDLKCVYAACGSDFTVVVQHTGRILAWGNNSFAQLGKLPDEDKKGLDGKMVLLKTTKRIIKLPNSFQNICALPQEILNIPTQIIQFSKVPKTINFFEKIMAYNPKSLHFTLETYYSFYNPEELLKLAMKYQNWQAASKVSFLQNYVTDALNYQLKSLEISSLDCIKQFCDAEEGGGEELFEDDDLKKQLMRNSILEYVETIDFSNDELLFDKIRVDPKDEVIIEIEKTPSPTTFALPQVITNAPPVLDSAQKVIVFFIKQTENSDNLILMQNILIKSMDFWLQNNLPVEILESILLKNMSKYFYPLSILLFCKNFNNEQQVAQFLKQLSTKFCLELCSMVLKNVKQTKVMEIE